jgi:hypothetical protein
MIVSVGVSTATGVSVLTSGADGVFELPQPEESKVQMMRAGAWRNIGVFKPVCWKSTRQKYSPGCSVMERREIEGECHGVPTLGAVAPGCPKLLVVPSDGGFALQLKYAATDASSVADCVINGVKRGDLEGAQFMFGLSVARSASVSLDAHSDYRSQDREAHGQHGYIAH